LDFFIENKSLLKLVRIAESFISLGFSELNNLNIVLEHVKMLLKVLLIIVMVLEISAGVTYMQREFLLNVVQSAGLFLRKINALTFITLIRIKPIALLIISVCFA